MELIACWCGFWILLGLIEFSIIIILDIRAGNHPFRFFMQSEADIAYSELTDKEERKNHLLPACPKWQHDVVHTDMCEQWRDSIKEYVGLVEFDENTDLEALSDDDFKKVKECKAIIEYFEKNKLMRDFLISELSKIKECEMGYKPYGYWQGDLYDEEFEKMYLEEVKRNLYFRKAIKEDGSISMDVLTSLELKMELNLKSKHDSLVTHGITYIKHCANCVFKDTKEKIRIYKETGKYYE